MSPHAHHQRDAAAVTCGVITVSDTRSEADDTSGQRIRALLEEHGHRVAFYRIVRDEPEQIGAAAMLSRATAGVAGQRVIFSVPGSTKAVELAMTKLILPQLGHVVGLVRG